MGAFSSRDAAPAEPSPHQHRPARSTKDAPAGSNNDEHDDGEEGINDEDIFADGNNIQMVWGAPEEGPGMWTEELFDDGRGHRLHDSAYYASRSDDDDDDETSSSLRDEIDSVAASEDDDDDDDEEDREPYYDMDEPRIVRAFHVGDAIDSLEDMPGVVEWLEVAMLRPPADGDGRMRPPYDAAAAADDDADEEEGDDEEVVHVEYSELLHRFVDLLHDPESQSIRELVLYDADVDKYEDSHRNEVERLLRDVVPAYATLQKLAFACGTLDAPLLRTLALALPTATAEARNDLWQFSLHDVSMDADALRVVANDMIRRNVLIRSLYLDLTRFSSAGCELVCRSLQHNTNLRRFYLGTNEITGGTLNHVAGPASPLRYLSVGGNWTQEGISELASQLKTNTRMLAVSLSGPIVGFHANDDSDTDTDDDDDEGQGAAVAAAERAAAPLVEMLRTYNYTLQKITFVERRGHCARMGVGRKRGCGPGVECIRWDCFGPYLRRNHQIRQARKVWEPDAYRVAPIGLWPRAFELVSDVPTLLFRLLRRGNAKALGQVVVGDHHPTNTSKKRRSRGSGVGGSGGRRPRR
jgi:hypothetical protein